MSDDGLFEFQELKYLKFNIIRSEITCKGDECFTLRLGDVLYYKESDTQSQ